MTPGDIIEATPPRAEHRQALHRALVAFSDRRAGAGDWPLHEVCLVIRDAGGAIAGGLNGHFKYGWLFVELIFVPEERRGRNLGAALLAMAEREACRRGGVGVWLDTFSFQAPGFYARHGYRVFGEIADYPAPHRRFFLSKPLDPAAPPAARHPEIELVAAPDPAHRRAIGDPLSRFNDTQIGGGPWPDEDLALLVAGPDGTTAAGLWARNYYNWMLVDLLFVPESGRRQGLGAALLGRAEAAARARGCHGVWLDTFSFQAPAYYARHGYRPFGAIDGYPAPHRRIFYSKRL